MCRAYSPQSRSGIRTCGYGCCLRSARWTSFWVQSARGLRQACRARNSGASMKKLLGMILLVCCANLASAQMPETALTMRGQRIIAEVASTDSERSTSLMHRRMLPENRGMLFVFPESAMHGMWMMNTYVPLSVAFIDERGVIINIEDMQPHTQNSH